jgi:hypothetical protein
MVNKRTLFVQFFSFMLIIVRVFGIAEGLA